MLLNLGAQPVAAPNSRKGCCVPVLAFLIAAAINNQANAHLIGTTAVSTLSWMPLF